MRIEHKLTAVLCSGLLIQLMSIVLASDTLYLSPDMYILPNPALASYNGLQTLYRPRQYFNVSELNFTAYVFNATVGGKCYWVNVTDTSNVLVNIHNFFDDFGVMLSFSKPSNVSIYCNDKGSPSHTHGISGSYDAPTKIYSGAVNKGMMGLHWNISASCSCTSSSMYGFQHSFESYKTQYGWGLGLHDLVTFKVLTYCKHGYSDIEKVTLELGDEIMLECYPHKASWDRPYRKLGGNITLDELACSTTYDGATKLLETTFALRVRSHEELMTQQASTVTVTSTIDGAVAHTQPHRFFVIPEQLGVLPLYPLQDWIPLFMGIMGMLMMVASPYWTVREFRRGNKHVAWIIGFAMVLFIVGFGMMIGWLWQ